MGLSMITEPAQEPLTTAEAKGFLREDLDAQDSEIDGFVAAARHAVEKFTRRRLITQEVRLTLDRFGHGGCRPVILPVAPIQSVDAVQYRDSAGAWQAVAAEEYELRISCGEPWELWPVYGRTWPVPGPGIDRVRVDMTVGYGDAGSDVPRDMMQALQFMVGHFERNRSAVVTGVTVAEMPLGFRHMLIDRVLHV